MLNLYMSQYFEGYNQNDGYNNNFQLTDDNHASELSEIKNYTSKEEDTESDTKIYKFENKYSIGGIACVMIIIIIILLYIYFNHYKK